MGENLQLQLDRLIQQQKDRPTLLLHSCCAPCSSYVLEYLTAYFDITLLYFNPNIWPEEEYHRRLAEQRRLLSDMPLPSSVKLVEGEYRPDTFFDSVRSMEQEPEGGARCEACFRLRLGEAVKQAQQCGSVYVGTTLSISPHKNAALLDRILRECSAGTEILPLPSDFKKRGGYQRSLELSKQYGLYRQDYCGCRFSMRDGVTD